MPDAIAWARPWATAKPFSRPMPRAGAWYPVIAENGATRVVLLIGDRKVAIQRHLLEFREERPTRFTVVTRARGEPNPAQGTPNDLGRTYGVCPSCGSGGPRPQASRRHLSRVRAPGRGGLVGNGLSPATPARHA